MVMEYLNSGNSSDGVSALLSADYLGRFLFCVAVLFMVILNRAKRGEESPWMVRLRSA